MALINEFISHLSIVQILGVVIIVFCFGAYLFIRPSK